MEERGVPCVVERRLIEAALEIVGSGGIAALSSAAICRRAKLSEPIFVRAFGSVETLLFAIYDDTATAVKDSVRAALVGRQSLVGTIRAGVDAYVCALLSDSRRARVVSELPTSSLAGGSRRRRCVEDLSGMAEQALASFDRETAPGHRHRVTAHAMAGATDVLVADWLSGSPPDRPPWDAVAGQLSRLYLSAAGVTPADEAPQS